MRAEIQKCSDSRSGASQSLAESDSHANELRQLASLADRDEARERVSKLTQNALVTTGRGLRLIEADLAQLDLSGFDLRGAQLSRAALHGTRLVGADLTDAVLICPGMERTDLTGAVLRRAYVHALAAQTCRLNGADLSDLRDATGSLWHGCSLVGATLTGAQLAGASFYQCDLSGADFTGANLQGSMINECTLRDGRLDRADVSQLTITKSSLTGASLREALGSGLVLQRLTDCDHLLLDGASLPHLRVAGVRARGWLALGIAATGADLNQVSLTESTFKSSDLSDASLVGCTLLGVRLDGASLVGARIRNSSLDRASLVNVQAENLHVVESSFHEVDASGLVGRCLVMRDCDLGGANLTGANLYRAMLTGDPPTSMNLSDARLDGAILVQAYVAADLRRAVLRGANCAYSRFSQSDLSGADASGTAMYQSTWVKVRAEKVTALAMTGPIFADRCPGLLEALEGSADSADRDTMVDWLRSLAELLGNQRSGST